LLRYLSEFRFVVLMTRNSKSNHFGAQGTFKVCIEVSRALRPHTHTHTHTRLEVGDPVWLPKPLSDQLAVRVCFLYMNRLCMERQSAPQ